MADASGEPIAADIDSDIETVRRQMPGSEPPDGTHRHVGDWLGAMHGRLAEVVSEHDRLTQHEQAENDAPKEHQ